MFLKTANRPLPRRQAIGLIGGGAFVFSTRFAQASTGIGTVVQVQGAGQVGSVEPFPEMRAGMDLFVGDTAMTGVEARAHLGLGKATEIHLGPASELQIDTFIAEVGGVIYLDGAIVFDRPEADPKLDLEFRTGYGRIGVRGTRFFAGLSNGVYSVFVDRGVIAVTAGNVTRQLAAGEGVELTADDQPPGPIRRWPEARINAALALVLGS